MSFNASLKGRRTGIDPLANSGPASLPGREQSYSTCTGGCASLHHRLISIAPPGREIASLRLPAVSDLAVFRSRKSKRRCVAAFHTLRDFCRDLLPFEDRLPSVLHVFSDQNKRLLVVGQFPDLFF